MSIERAETLKIIYIRVHHEQGKLYFYSWMEEMMDVNLFKFKLRSGGVIGILPHSVVHTSRNYFWFYTQSDRRRIGTSVIRIILRLKI